MRALVLPSPQPVAERPLVPQDVPDPEPAAGQLLLEVTVCGVCHTDLHTVEGDLELPRTPITPGHQIVGKVVAMGDEVSGFQIGDRVGVGWLGWTCGACRFCQSGQENLCPQARFTGLHIAGGYAPFTVVDARYTYPLPATFSDLDAAPLLCAGIIGFRSLRLSGVQPGGVLGLYGFGASAHLAIQVARHWDCTVYVFTRSDEHRRHARDLGAVWAGGAEEETPEPLDGAITFAPAGWIVHRALAHLRPGGTLAINAVHLSPIPELPYHLLYGERTVRSVANFTRSDAQDFLRLAAEIPLRATVTEYPLLQANEALQDLKASAVNGAAVLRI